MNLTSTMRDVLVRAERQPHTLRRTHAPGPGRPAWPAPFQTLYALMRHELLDHEVTRNRDGHWVERWTLTDTGRLVLHPPPRVVSETKRLMHRAHTSTLQMQGGIWVTRSMPEPEQVDPNELRREWREYAERRHLKAKRGGPTPTERLERALADARERGDEAEVQRRLNALERATRRAA